MSRRKTVKLDLPYVQERIKAVFRRNVIFCEAMGRPQQRTWVTEWNREHNLPSPEEAARMCVLLQTTPEEILVEQADIDLVNGLLEQEREKSAKKEPAETDRLNPDYLKLNDANRAAIDAAIAALLASQQQGD